MTGAISIFRYSGIFFCFVSTILALLVAGTAGASENSDLWNRIKTGEGVVMMRHALAPGTGDPDNFDVNDCNTQRNLSDKGRDQARSAGNRFRSNGIETARVFSSQWCRCRETAELLKLGPVDPLPALNSFYGRSDNRDPQTEALKKWLVTQPKDRPLVLVTHQVNISALAGTSAVSGEMVVIKIENDGSIRVLGKL